MSFFTDAFDALGGKEHHPAGFTKEQQRNFDNNGSATVSEVVDANGLGYTSSLTGNYYHSPEDAVADEKLYLQDPKAWAAPGKIDPMAPALGEQTPIENPNAPPEDVFNDPNIVAPPPAPPERAAPAAPLPPRAGFTNEVGVKNKLTSTLPVRPVSTPMTAVTPPAALPPQAVAAASGPPVGTPPPAPGDQAPDIHRDKIDSILNGLGGYENSIAALASDNTGQSVAEAQLMKADALAKIRARDELAANQAGALGAARSARNRGDRALLERGAVGEQAYLGSQAQRQDVLRQAELEGNQSILRATETNYDREFKLKALEAAGNLGLNRAALEVDISKADLASANNWVNNEAQKALQSGAIDEQQYEALLNFTSNRTAQLLAFTQGMAGIQYEYDKLSTDDQNVADGLLMQKYGIDKQTMIALKQIKQSGKFKWDQVLTALVGGAATGGTSVIAHEILGGSDNNGGTG